MNISHFKKRTIFVAVFGLIASAVSQNVSNAYQYPSTVSNYNYRIFVPATTAPAAKALVAAPTLSFASLAAWDTGTATVTPSGTTSYPFNTPVSFNVDFVISPASTAVQSQLANACQYSSGGMTAPTAPGDYSVICSGPATVTALDGANVEGIYTVTYGSFNFSIAAQVPDLSGLTRLNADAAILAAGLIPGVESATSARATSVNNSNFAGIQSPAAGTSVPAGSTVDFNYYAYSTPSHTVTYSLGGGSGTLPTQGDVVEGGSFTTAASTGLSKTGYTFNKWNDGSANYAAGTPYGMSTANVTLTATWTLNPPPPPVYVAPTTNVVPNIVDKTKADATTALNGAGFGIGVSKGTTEEGATADNDGKISWQSLTGTQVIGQAVDYKTYAYTPKEPAAAIVLPLAPAPAPAPVQQFGTTAVQIDKYALYKSIVDVAGNTKLVAITHDSGTALKLTNGVEASLSAKLKLNLTNDGVQVTSIAGWTGHIAFPVVATVNGKAVELYIGVEEDPAPAAKPLFNLVNLKSAKISWNASTSQVTYYNVYFGTKLVCNTSKTSCSVPASSISSLKSGLQIEAVGHESTYSTKVAPKYKTGAVAAAGIIHFANGSSTISASDKKSLDALVKSLKKLGVTAIQINGHADVTGAGSANTKLAVARGNAVKAYIAKQLPKVKINVKGFSSKVPAASTKTAAGLASSRRAEILVG